MVADLVRDRPEQEPLGPSHPLVADHDQVGARLLGHVEDRVGGAALARVDPPPEVRTLHGRLIASIDAYGREIDKARSAFRSTSTARIIEAQTQLISAITAVSGRINRTIAEINRALKE